MIKAQILLWKTIGFGSNLDFFKYFSQLVLPSSPHLCHLWCNMLQTSLGRSKYVEAKLDEHPLLFFPINSLAV